MAAAAELPPSDDGVAPVDAAIGVDVVAGDVVAARVDDDQPDVYKRDAAVDVGGAAARVTVVVWVATAV